MAADKQVLLEAGRLAAAYGEVMGLYSGCLASGKLAEAAQRRQESTRCYMALMNFIQAALDDARGVEVPRG